MKTHLYSKVKRPFARASIAALLVCILLLSFPLQGFGQGDGAQINFLTPIGVNVIPVTYQNIDSNFRLGQTLIGAAEISTRAASISLAHRFSIKGRFAMMGIGLGYQHIAADVDLSSAIPGFENSFKGRVNRYGVGDPLVTFRYGLIGTPALSPAEWVEKDQEFQLYTQVQARLPLGSYNPRRYLNPGFNRYTLELSVPMVIPLDGAKRRTYLEISPEVIFFGDNDDPFQPRVNTVTQDPLYTLEFQVSHQLPRGTWLALGVQYQEGGGTNNDGVANENALDQWFGEASLGFVANKNLGFVASYGELFAELNNARGRLFRVRAVFIF